MQSDFIPQALSGLVSLTGVSFLSYVAIGHVKKWPGPLKLVNRGVTHLRAVISVTEEVIPEALATASRRYSTHLDEVRKDW